MHSYVSIPDFIVGDKAALIVGDTLRDYCDMQVGKRSRITRPVEKDGVTTDVTTIGPWTDMRGEPSSVRSLVQTGATNLGGGLDLSQAIADAEATCDFVFVATDKNGRATHLEKYKLK